MARNAIQFQKGLSLTKCIEQYGTEVACREALFKVRRPKGFRCPKCGKDTYLELRSRPVIQCDCCHHQASLTAGNLFENVKLFFRTWFLAIFRITESKFALLVMAVSRNLGVSCNTAWLFNHKNTQAMRVRDDRRPQRMRMTPLKGFRNDSVDRWARIHLSADAEVISDRLACFGAIVETGPHWSIDTGGGPSSVEKPEFTWVNTVLGNVENAIDGTFHGIAGKRLGRYLGALSTGSTPVSTLTGCPNGSLVRSAARRHFLERSLRWREFIRNQVSLKGP